MLRFIKRLFGTRAPISKAQPSRTTYSVVELSPQSGGRYASDAYFDTMSRMQEAVSNRNFEVAARLVCENLRYIPHWVRETRREYGSFDIGTIPSLQQGGTVLALVGDDEGLAQLHEVVSSVPELEPWAEGVERHQQDRRLFEAIQQVVAAQPNRLQTEIKGLIGEDDGHRVAKLISYLEKAGKIVRVKAGRSYRISPPGSPDIQALPPKRIISSHRTDSKPPTLREIEVASLSYVPLPRAPLRWEEPQARRERAGVPELEDEFEVCDADWRIGSIENISPAQRPDTAFRQMHPTDSGLVMIDDLGKAEGLGQIEAAALRYNRAGEVKAKKGLQWGIYRVGVHPLGRGLIAMSQDCVVHAYDDDLKPILETPLTDAHEVFALRKRLEIPDAQLKNHIRCVALSRDASRYLFTAVDEAWCVDMGGKGLWGAKLPVKEGWTRVATPSREFGTSADVDRALELLGLSFPITPKDLKQRYRQLAKQWHPDLNLGNAQAGEKMKALTVATEVLTGVEASALPRYTGATFVREMGRMEFQAGGNKLSMSVGMHVGEIHASDWIYAASFAADSDAVYLAGYSGRVVLVDEKGAGVRVYDIGSVPRRIVDTGDYLYLLTDTRLYVLHDDVLHALVDTFDGGDLVVAQTAFGLLEKKRLRWFREDGRYLGTVISRDPIRRVYASDDGMVIETRRRRAIVQDVPSWWD